MLIMDAIKTILLFFQNQILGMRWLNTLAGQTLSAASIGREPEVEKVTDMARIVSYGVISTPALVVGERVVSVGKILSAGEIAGLLKKEGL
ncbi:thioredoxin family protein [Cloacibacillus evryensis]|uniref:thioredoxin family protein n=2 Tax=Cloacibacillus evryensis TaxID=508460 RepID=UPI0004BBA86A|nr:thioredoxin family protein [Cloacibacillus evryensis]